jgi:hypothetical protein
MKTPRKKAKDTVMFTGTSTLSMRSICREMSLQLQSIFLLDEMIGYRRLLCSVTKTHL